MANKIYIQLDFTADGAEKAIDDLNKKLSGIGSTTEKSTKVATASITGFTESLFRAVLGVNLASDAISVVARALADFTKEAIKSAALFEELEGSNRVLAASAGISQAAMGQLKAQLRELNIEGNEAAKVINQALLEGITDPKNIEAIGQLAQEIERITGKDVVEGAQSIALAVASGNTRRLRELGLIVDLQRAETLRENQLRRFLTDRELIQVRLAEIQRVYNERVKDGDLPTQTLRQRWRDFEDTLDEFKRKFGEAFIGPLSTALEIMNHILEASNAIQTALRGATLVPGALLGSKASPSAYGSFGEFVGEKLLDYSGAALDVALPPPRDLDIAPKAGLYAPHYGGPPAEPTPTKELLEQRKLHKEAVEAEIQAEQQLQNERRSSLKVVESLIAAQTTYGEKQAKNLEDSKAAAAATVDVWTTIQVQRALGIKQLIEEGEQIKRNKALTVDDFGEPRYKKLSPKYIQDVNAQTAEKVRQLNLRLDNELNQHFGDIAEARVKIIQNLITQLWIEPARQALLIWDQLRQDTEKIADLRYQQSVQGIGQRTQAELESLNAIEAVTLKQAVALEIKKRDITIKGLQERNSLQQDQIEVETEREVQKEFGRLALAGVTDQKIYQQRRESLEKIGQLQKDIAAQVTDAAIKEAAIRANAEVQQAILAQSRQTFDKIKDFTGQIFDAFTQKSTSVFKAVADVFKNTFINALKEIVSSQFAIALYGLLGYGKAYSQGAGQPVSFTPQLAGSGYTGLGIGQSLLGAAFGYGGKGIAAPTPVGVTSSGVSFDTGGGGGIQERNREMDARYYAATGQLPEGGLAPVNLPSLQSLGISSPTAAPAFRNPSQLSRVRDAFNIGKPIQLPGVGRDPIPWAAATPRQRLGAILSSSGFKSLAATVGVSAALAGLQRGGVLGNALTVGGAALAGYGLSTMLGMSGPQGVIAGAGVGLFAAGIQRGGAAGVAMTTFGGALTGAVIGSMIAPGVGTIVGAAVGAGIGLGAGIARLFYKTADERVRAAVKQVYGIDIPDASIRKQILDIAKQRYGGNIDVAIRSQEVQDLVRLYSLTQGQTANLPRPMYNATFEQSAAGGLQVQPVYSNGQLVANPYSGVTTSQWKQAGLYVQLNPAQANALFEGRVVNVVQSNPAIVSGAAASGAASGDSRTALRSAIMDPLTVTR